MKLLLDANLSPAITAAISDAGYETSHVGDVGLLRASDSEIFQFAASSGYVVITADSDFPMMLALRGVDRPSVVLLRHVSELPREEHARLLTANLPLVAADLGSGAIVSLSPTRLAVRNLPIG
jgi:predicted nuclease of predicted toxin-antitoxin system